MTLQPAAAAVPSLRVRWGRHLPPLHGAAVKAAAWLQPWVPRAARYEFRSSGQRSNELCVLLNQGLEAFLGSTHKLVHLLAILPHLQGRQGVGRANGRMAG